MKRFTLRTFLFVKSRKDSICQPGEDSGGIDGSGRASANGPAFSCEASCGKCALHSVITNMNKRALGIHRGAGACVPPRHPADGGPRSVATAVLLSC